MNIIHFNEVRETQLFYSDTDLDSALCTELMFGREEEEDPELEELLPMPEFEEVVTKIYCRLMSLCHSQDIIHKIPHINRMDLSVAYYIEMKISDDGCSTRIIDNALLEKWNISKEQLDSVAWANTLRNKPAILFPLAEYLGLHEDQEPSIYVLSNKSMILGATAIFYPDRLKRIAQKLDTDFYILPSSIHECLIVPKEGSADAMDLINIVKSVNETELTKDEILSDNVYLYERKTDKVSICHNPHHIDHKFDGIASMT